MGAMVGSVDWQFSNFLRKFLLLYSKLNRPMPSNPRVTGSGTLVNTTKIAVANTDGLKNAGNICQELGIFLNVIH
jgi:hypothetical protein